MKVIQLKEQEEGIFERETIVSGILMTDFNNVCSLQSLVPNSDTQVQTVDRQLPNVAISWRL